MENRDYSLPFSPALPCYTRLMIYCAHIPSSRQPHANLSFCPKKFFFVDERTMQYKSLRYASRRCRKTAHTHPCIYTVFIHSSD